MERYSENKKTINFPRNRCKTHKSVHKIKKYGYFEFFGIYYID